MNAPDEFIRRRQRMVKEQIKARRIRSRRVLEAMEKVPRHRFVPEEFQDIAYEDRPIAIGQSQTISQPFVVALMTQLLNLKEEEIVLEIGTGSGYQAAILAQLAKHVYTVERHKSLAERAAAVLQVLGYDNVTVRNADGSAGWAKHAPYQGIIVTAAAPDIPQPLLDQLAQGGRLVIPVGGVRGQQLELWKRKGPKFTHESIVPVAFVPLRGDHGWERDWDEFD